MQSSLVLWLNARMASHPLLVFLMPLLGDIFVFSYPIYLIYLYFKPTPKISSGWDILESDTTNIHTNYKHINRYSALTIFFTTLLSIATNYVIKFFVPELRPFHVLDLTLDPKKALILDGLPIDTFPSDHASVGMAVAMSTLLLWYHHNDKQMKLVWRFFLITSLVMNVARITIWVHRPADILGGIWVGIMIASIMMMPRIQDFFQNHIYNHLIALQRSIFWWFSKKKSA